MSTKVGVDIRTPPFLNSWIQPCMAFLALSQLSISSVVIQYPSIIIYHRMLLVEHYSTITLVAILNYTHPDTANRRAFLNPSLS